MQQLKEEQINVLLEYIEKKLEEYKKGITLRDNRIVEAKNYDSVVNENQQLKEYI